ncbi:MAG: DUF1592 domain-containing protein [Planctomycetota bacterium]
MSLRIGLIACAIAVCGDSTLAQDPATPVPATSTDVADSRLAHERHFERQVAPILAKHCLECHDAAAAEGGLVLSRKAAAFAGGDSGVAIVPHRPDESLLWESIEFDQMPHDRPPLAAEDKAVLKAWIRDGAVWPVDYVDPSIYRHPPREKRWVSRLTVDEYVATIADLFGVDVQSSARRLLPPDLRADGFRNTAYNLNADLKHIVAYAALADEITAQIDPVRFAKPFARDQTLTDKNMRQIVQRMGKVILRGPLTKQEVALYRGVSTTVALAGGDYRDALAHTIAAMLQSPRFLYRIEAQARDDAEPEQALWHRDAYEVASRLSYSIWGSTPDRILLKAADQDRLSSEDQVRKQIKRMLGKPRAIDRSIDFVTQWLDLDRLENLNPDAQRFPNWSPQLAADMKRETIETFRHLVWDNDTPLVRLLDAPFTFASPDLARHYGLKSKPEPWAKYDVSDVPWRGGILTHGSVLTIGGDDASMVTRGLFVLSDLLLSEVGDPPPGLDTTPVPTGPGLTHRMVAMQRIESGGCGGCHKRFEPLAFGLERYDGIGGYQETDEFENRLRQDGEILFPGTAEPVPYKTIGQLSELLASHPRVAESLTRKLIQFSIGRPLDVTDARRVRGVYERSGRQDATYPSILTETLLAFP